MKFEHHVFGGSGGQTGELTTPGKGVEGLLVTHTAGAVRVMYTYSSSRSVGLKPLGISYERVLKNL